ncbi:DNA glycosylase [Ganoderma leucocontextum]|nr:DNA glycosylase [Ganoderma leucocontextum]
MRPSLALKLIDNSSCSRHPIHTKQLLSLLFTKPLRFPGNPGHNNILGNMRTTRSATRKATAMATGQTMVAVEDSETVAVVAKTNGKRKTSSATKEPVQKRTKSSSTKPSDEGKKAPPASVPTIPIVPIPTADGEELVPAVLTFSFEDAKRHLISADPRFDDIFNRVSCKPFEQLERVDPFRTLANSILGQQISWKAARAITHKFVRLFDPSIPEDVSENQSNFFPTAHQVVTKDVASLRTAGLSGRKAEYVLDLAARFANGSLSTRKLLEADDEELHRMLTEVRGIGTWTVDMFAIFSLRRSDILPVGDLGVQRGMLRWFISLHSPSYPVSIRKDKLVDQNTDTQPAGNSSEGTSQHSSKSQSQVRAATPDESALPPVPVALAPPAPKQKGKAKAANGAGAEADTGMVLPPAFTPSINKTLNMLGKPDEVLFQPPPLPEGLTVAQMKTRMNGKNKIKGALLTPKEMETLAESWRPYRSLGWASDGAEL